jgi:hypothetical protein
MGLVLGGGGLYSFRLPGCDFGLFAGKLSLKVLQVTLFVSPFIHSLNQVFKVLFQVWIDAKVQCVVVGRENCG